MEEFLAFLHVFKPPIKMHHSAPPQLWCCTQCSKIGKSAILIYGLPQKLKSKYLKNFQSEWSCGMKKKISKKMLILASEEAYIILQLLVHICTIFFHFLEHCELWHESSFNLVRYLHFVIRFDPMSTTLKWSAVVLYIYNTSQRVEKIPSFFDP